MLFIANGALVGMRTLFVDVHHLLLVWGRDHLIVHLLLTVVNEQALHVPLLLSRVVHPVVGAIHKIVHVLVLLRVIFLAWPQRLQRAVIFLLVHAHLRVRKASIIGIYITLEGIRELAGDVVGDNIRWHTDAVTIHGEERLRIIDRD